LSQLELTVSKRKRAGVEKLLWILAFLVLPFCQAQGQDLSAPPKWFEQVDGGAVIPAGAEVSRDYAIGLGGDVLMGYRFNRDFSLAADVGYFYCGQDTSGETGAGWTYVPLMLLLRYNIGGGWIRPYLLLGAGAALNSYSIAVGSSGPAVQSSHNEIDWLLAPGLGILFKLEPELAMYLQTRLDVDFTPVSIGLPPSENPTLFIPVKIGIIFSAI
jgi:opacity protein-like surface antigen